MAQHHLAGAWNEIQQGAKQEWGQLPDDGFEELERHRDLLVSLFQISHLVTREEADHQIGQWRPQVEYLALAPPAPAPARWRLWGSA